MNTLFREFNMDDFVEVRVEEKAEKIAENLLKDGMSKEFVVKNTELSMRQIEKIINKINKNK